MALLPGRAISRSLRTDALIASRIAKSLPTAPGTLLAISQNLPTEPISAFRIAKALRTVRLRIALILKGFHGHLSAELADLCAQRLEQLLQDRTSVLYFADASGIDSADLRARNRVLATLNENRGRFSGIRILNWSGGVSSTGRALLTGLLGLVVVADDHDHFQRMLLTAAPGGRELIAACAAAGSPRL